MVKGKGVFVKEHQAGWHPYYHLYRASYVHATDIPCYGKDSYQEVVENGLYTVTRAKREHVTIDTTAVRGWYKLTNGYTPMFWEKDEDDEVI